jgi:hypothetical protein
VRGNEGGLLGIPRAEVHADARHRAPLPVRPARAVRPHVQRPRTVRQLGRARPGLASRSGGGAHRQRAELGGRLAPQTPRRRV